MPVDFRITAQDPRLELTTARLWLRRFGPDDADLLTLLDSDPAVMRFIDGGGPPRPELDAQAVVRFLRQYEDHPGLGFFAAHRIDTGDYIGWFHFRPDRHDPAHVDLGYRLVRAAWGQGFATEASRALIERGFARGVPCVVAYALAANRASWHVMEKLGMQRTGEFVEDRFPGADKAAVKYALARPVAAHPDPVYAAPMSAPITVGPGQVRTIPRFVDPARCRQWIDQAWSDTAAWKKRFDYIHSYGRAWYLELEYGMLHVYHSDANRTNDLLRRLDGLVPALAGAAAHMEAPDGRTGLPARARQQNLGPYWADAGVIAMTKGTQGVVHADYEGLSPYPAMMFDARTRAYSAVLMLCKPQSGGDLKVWTRRWLANEHANVEGLPFEIAEYGVGSLALFDSFCYHQILESTLAPETPYRAVAAMHFVYRDEPHPHFEYWY